MPVERSLSAKAVPKDPALGDEGADAAAGGPPPPSMATVVVFVFGQCFAASTLVVVNKWAMNSFHPPAVSLQDHPKGYTFTLSLIQFVTAAVVAKLVGVLGIARCDTLELKRALAYFPAAGMFMITIVAGNAVMNYANISTFLVLRALVPLPCVLAETLIYSDPLPPVLSWAGLVTVVVGAVMYCTSTGGIATGAKWWSVLFLALMPVDGLLIKHAVSASKLSSWGLVYYNNLLASLPLIFYAVFFEVPNGRAFTDMVSALISPEARMAVVASCIGGILLSYFQMTTRYYISATAFMVLGVANKFLSVVWNEIFIERDSTPALLGVMLTLCGAVGWQLSMGISGSVKVRAQAQASQTTSTIAFIATLSGLLAAAVLQYSILADSHQKSDLL